MFRVVRQFKEMKHEGHIYQVGDLYPKEGFEVAKSRLKELSTGKNKYNQVFIEKVIEEDTVDVPEEISEEVDKNADEEVVEEIVEEIVEEVGEEE